MQGSFELPGIAPTLGLFGGHAAAHQGMRAAGAASLEDAFVLDAHAGLSSFRLSQRATYHGLGPFGAKPQRLPLPHGDRISR
jgi:hypothetical protein